MNNICPVCGCKTEELDFSDYSLGNEEVRVCSYCRKQLALIDSETELSESCVRWLDNIISREVEQRSAACKAALTEMRARPTAVKEATPAAPVASGQAQGGYQFNTPQKSNAVQSGQLSIEELEKRFLKLEHDFYAFKRRLFLMNIAEIVVPFLLMVILVIIFLNSGLLDSLKNIISAGTGGAINYSGANLFGRIML